MRKMFLLLLSLGILLPVTALNHGVLEGSQVTWNAPVPLKGEWLFYDNALITQETPPSAPTLQKVPGTWTNYTLTDGKKMLPQGYASFSLELKDLPREPLAIYLKDSTTSYRLYFQEFEKGEYGEPQLIIFNGNPAKSREEHQPMQKPEWGTLNSLSGQGRILIESANYLNDQGGIWSTPFIGTLDVIKRMRLQQNLFNALLIGILVSMALHYLFFFLIRRKELYNLYFSLFCLLLALRQVFADRILTLLLPSDTIPHYFTIHTRLDFIVIYLAILVFAYLINSLFPRYQWKGGTKVLTGITLLGSLGTLLGPLPESLFILMIFQVLLVVVALYCLWVYFRALRKRESGAILGITGILLFTMAVINDLLHSRVIIQTAYLGSLGFLVFIYTQSLIMSLRYNKALTSVERLNKSLSRFVPQEIMKFLGKSSILDLHLGDAVERTMTVLFADIRQFTTLSESMTPEETFNFLNSYLKRISPVIRKHRGYIDKYLGDGIMALFPEEPQDALLAALEIQEELKIYNQHRANSGYQAVQVGVGIHTGELILGTIGEQERLEGTVIADAVNLSSRLEELTKTFGTQIIVSEAAIDFIQDDSLDFRFLGKVSVRGRNQSIRIYEVVEKGSPKEDYKNEFELGVQLFSSGQREKAKEIFTQLSSRYPQDKGVSFFLKKL